MWTVVVPVKGTAAGKSRMSPTVDSTRRALLAEAFALDTLAALQGTPSVGRGIVVTDPDAGPTAALRTLGAEIVADPGLGLNPAITAALDTVSHGSSGEHLAVLLGDLPSLRPADLAAALRLAEEHPLAVVADAEGSGTTLLTARAGEELVPQFGSGSAARHLAAGHQLLEVPPTSTLRLDVDTEADLAEAIARGVGEHTRRALG